MRAVVQRVQSAYVSVAGEIVGEIGPGLLVYIGVESDDDDVQAIALAKKVSTLRIFPDEQGLQNRSVLDEGGEILAVSAFSVCADARKGRRPSFGSSATSELARPLFDSVCIALAGEGLCVRHGVFGADMKVSSINDGPICILLDTGKKF